MNDSFAYYVTREDAAEIYYALTDEALMDAIGPDGENLADGSYEPTPADIQVFVGAVTGKLDALREGFYGRDSLTRKWTRHLESILAMLEDK